ncbi:hypothetical protein [Aliiruegeria lutimaris]|uniref:Tse2 ADP-ribosyltransferase toxin domain-containing protein n=1 Tax=Aliiruegeria lutimaris TaxID=571298 RepID=A0A1G9IZ42_9RHOB|nr:hypothetical protein [Aliiruegeria lutimaris]SDL30365.1 hypothetical protein SAMN04488026_107718 [Aliiruegeria lutimaris]
MARTHFDLFRAIIDGTFIADLDPVAERPVHGVLYPRTEAETHFDRRGREWTRRAEMTVFCIEKDCIVDTDGGTVLFDVAGWYGNVGWQYFEIPEGTELPDSLVIEGTGRIRRNRSGTLQGKLHVIVPRNRMSLQAYRAALDGLARNAIVRQIQLASSG